MNCRIPRSVVLLLPALGFAWSALAQSTQHEIPYQGLLDLDGVPQTGNFDFVFELYDSETEGDCAVAPDNCLWNDEFPAVSIHRGRFSVLLGSNLALPDTVWQNDAVYLAIKVKQTADAEYTPLAGRKKIHAVPKAARAETAKNYHVTGDVVVEGAVRSNSIAPRYQDWNTAGYGDGGAAICNDDVGYQALMVTGNTSAGGVRKINLYDDVYVHGSQTVNGHSTTSGNMSVNGTLTVNGNVNRTGCHWIHFPYTHISSPERICPEGHFQAGAMTKYNGDYGADVYPGAIYCCKIGH